MNTYGYTKKVNTSFDETLDAVEGSLMSEGFGVLTRIDVKAKMQEKLGKQMQEYMILGACNPSLAYDAIRAEYEIGLLLPCNVIVYKKQEQVYVSAILPSAAMSMIHTESITLLAHKAEEKLKRAIDTL